MANVDDMINHAHRLSSCPSLSSVQHQSLSGRRNWYRYISPRHLPDDRPDLTDRFHTILLGLIESSSAHGLKNFMVARGQSVSGQS